MSAVSFSFVPSEIALGLGIVLVTGASFYLVESVFSMSSTIKNRFVELLPYTASSEDKQIVLQQDTTKFPNAQPILPSDNERTGIEFSYSFYLLVNENTFEGQDTLHNVFYKGYSNNPWPLQSPGVYIRGNVNTMRILLNSYKDPFAYVDIENIPVGKWFHVVLNYQNTALEIHINGRLTKKQTYTDSLPNLNYENITIFSNNVTTINRPNAKIPNIQFKGSIFGKLSNLVYTRYAISYTEIQSLFKKGPSSITKSPMATETPPYFADSWWANQ